jgi:hypothetical protein
MVSVDILNSILYILKTIFSILLGIYCNRLFYGVEIIIGFKDHKIVLRVEY